MVEINQLSTVDSIGAGDSLPVFSTAQGITQRASMTQLAEYMNGVVVSPVPRSVYAAPSATGFSVALSGHDNQWLILTPVAGYAAGTIVLPLGPLDRQTVNVNSSQSVTALTVNGNGKTVTGVPTALAANAFFTLRYDGVAGVWYRVA